MPPVVYATVFMISSLYCLVICYGGLFVIFFTRYYIDRPDMAVVSVLVCLFVSCFCQYRFIRSTRLNGLNSSA